MADGSTTSGKKRDSLKALRHDLSGITARLQAADAATEQSVEALKTALKALAKHGDKDSAAVEGRHAKLDSQIAALKSRLTAMIRDTQRAVNSDLKAVLADPRLSTLAQAIDTADARLRRTETAQAQNLARLQGYIADLAREMDKNLGEERKARQAALISVTQKQEALDADVKNCTETLTRQSETLNTTTDLIKTVEADTATALRDMGEKIATFAQQATEARQEQQREIKGKVTDIALETQRNFDLYRDGLDRNVEAIQAAHESAKHELMRDLETLRTRLETLEYGMRPMAAASAASLDDAFTPPADTQTSELHLVETPPEDPLQGETPPYIEAANPDTYAPSPYGDDAVPVNPYTQAEAPAALVYPAAQQQPQPQSPYAPIQGQSPYADPQYNSPYELTNSPQDMPPNDPAAAYGPVETYSQPQTLDPNMAQTPYMGADDMPYSNPAYAEAQPTMQQSRPGGAVEASIGGAKRSALFTPNNLRAAVLGVAVLGGSYFAYNKVFGAQSTPNNTPPSNVFVEATPDTDLVADNAQTTLPNTTSIKTLEPIGNYAEDLNRPVNNTDTTLTALETAAAEGNEIAEYQLGLLKLQNGNVDDALTLLRKAANKGQPAAQYRLAKLYEAGNGVAADLVTARELIEKAARNGNRIAMHDLANFYANGIGGAQQDLELAAKWFEKAAERGVVDSQYNVGYLYEFGFGVTQNPVEAYVWYGIAAKQGDTEASRRLKILNETLSKVEIDSAKKRIDGFKSVKINQVANGVFKDLPWQPKQPSTDSSTQVAQAQTLLNSLGYSVGAADGQIGAQTRTAIIAFEKANGLPETGRVNTALVDQLSLAAGV